MASPRRLAGYHGPFGRRPTAISARLIKYGRCHSGTDATAVPLPAITARLITITDRDHGRHLDIKDIRASISQARISFCIWLQSRVPAFCERIH